MNTPHFGGMRECLYSSYPGTSCAWNQICQGEIKLEQKESFIRSDSAATPGRELSLKSHTFLEIYCHTFADSGDLGKHPNLHVFGWTELFDFWRTQTRGTGYSWIMGSLGLNSNAHIKPNSLTISVLNFDCSWAVIKTHCEQTKGCLQKHPVLLWVPEDLHGPGQQCLCCLIPYLAEQPALLPYLANALALSCLSWAGAPP